LAGGGLGGSSRLAFGMGSWHQRAHELGYLLRDRADREGEHDGEGEADPQAHLGEAADGVALESEDLVESGVDPFQRGSGGVEAVPAWGVAGDRGEDAVVLVEADADDATEVSLMVKGAALALGAAVAVEPAGGSRAAVAESAAVLLETPEGHRWVPEMGQTQKSRARSL
jgi:hypothetical protein